MGPKASWEAFLKELDSVDPRPVSVPRRWRQALAVAAAAVVVLLGAGCDGGGDRETDPVPIATDAFGKELRRLTRMISGLCRDYAEQENLSEMRERFEARSTSPEDLAAAVRKRYATAISTSRRTEVLDAVEAVCLEELNKR